MVNGRRLLKFEGNPAVAETSFVLVINGFNTGVQLRILIRSLQLLQFIVEGASRDFGIDEQIP